jgi:ribonuclease BN (tRNA processing enzyme)
MKHVLFVAAALGLFVGHVPIEARQTRPDTAVDQIRFATGPAEARGVGTRLILLGTQGGPVPSTFRSQPANLLVVDGEPYLIDAGDGVVRQLAAVGMKAGDLRNIFLTHLHWDHTAGIASLIAFRWAGLEGNRLNFVGPPGTSELVHLAIKYLDLPIAIYAAQYPPHYPAPEDMVSTKDVDVRSPMVVYQDSKVRVTAVENSHYSTMSMPLQNYGPVRSYSYRFDTPSRSIVFVGDSGPSDALVKLAKGADILVSEVIDVDTVMIPIRRSGVPESGLDKIAEHMRIEHMQPEEIGKLAAAADVKMVVLSHFSGGSLDTGNITAFTDGVRKFYGGPVIAGRDLDEF